MSWLRPSKCTRCGRQRGGCICRNVERGHVKAAQRKGVDPRPRLHQCPDGKTRTMRGGICPGPDC